MSEHMHHSSNQRHANPEVRSRNERQRQGAQPKKSGNKDIRRRCQRKTSDSPAKKHGDHNRNSDNLRSSHRLYRLR